MDYYSSSRQKKILPEIKYNNMVGIRNEPTYSTKEKTISCSVCLARVPASQIDKHEIQCRQDALSKKSKNGGVRKGANSYAPPSRSSKKPPEPEYTPSPVIQRPLTLMCYICGREYGTRSLRIHLKTCKEKWDIEQGNSVLKNRRPCPQAPPGFEELIQKDNITRKDIQNYNNRAFDAYNYEVLVPCQNCGRTFKPESLIPHQKSCKPNNPLKPLSNAQKEYQAERTMNPNPNGNLDLVPCRKCGRKFVSDRISKHESVCKPGPTKQALRKQKQIAVKTQQLNKSNGYFSSQKSNNWRQQHEEFQNQLKSMRTGGGSQSKQGNRPTVSQQYPQFSQPKSFSQVRSKQNIQETSQRHIVNCNNLGSKQRQSPGVSFGKDTVFVKSPSQPKNGNYKMNQNIFEDDYDSIPSYATPARSLISKNYPSLNTSNIRSTSSRTTNNSGMFSIRQNDRDSWMKPMGQKQQKTHDMLYGIGAFSGPQISNNSPFPAPSGYGMGR